MAGNARRHAETVLSADADVVVFPELSLTGYELDAATIAPSDERLASIADACRATGSMALAGAPLVAPAGGRSIGMLAIDGGGARVVYRKMWLGGEEPKQFVAGDTPAVIERDGWRIGLAICRDTGVPEHAASTMALGCHVYAAGVLESIADADVQPRRASAIADRHDVWVVVSSFAGSTGGGYDVAAGGSAIWQPGGSNVRRASTGVGGIARLTIAPEDEMIRTRRGP